MDLRAGVLRLTQLMDETGCCVTCDHRPRKNAYYIPEVESSSTISVYRMRGKASYRSGIGEMPAGMAAGRRTAKPLLANNWYMGASHATTITEPQQ